MKKFIDTKNTDKFSKKEILKMAIDQTFKQSQGRVISKDDFIKRVTNYEELITELLK